MIVAKAREPIFYRDLGVPDTVDGRFDLILLHLWMVLRRLRQGEGGPDRAQALFDRFCIDMDDNLREMGVGDLTVPKRMQAFGEAFYGRAAAYDLALSEARENDEGPLAQSICKNILNGEGIDERASACRLCASDPGPAGSPGRRRLAWRVLDFPANATGRTPADQTERQAKPPIPGVVRCWWRKIPDTGLHREIEADPVAREAMAELAEVREILSAHATFDVTLGRDGRVHVAGRVRARVGQTCVVTLDPIETEIDEAIDLEFAPPEQIPQLSDLVDAAEEGEEEIPDPPEPIINGMIDLGRVATDALYLAIDPYPRKPGAVFEPKLEEVDPEEHPFAALKALQTSAPAKGRASKPKSK